MFKPIQQKLVDKGHSVGSAGIDGFWGKNSEAAFEAACPGKLSEINALNLAPAAKCGALLLALAHPSVKFTSGRRGYVDQARAMASNVVKNRRWISQTYMLTAESQRLQLVVNALSAHATQAEIQQALANQMASWSDAQKAKLSKHFSGEAFDVQPVTKDAAAIKATIRALPRLQKFLEKEGGLVRWHAQFS